MGHIGPSVRLDAPAFIHDSAHLYGRTSVGPGASIWTNAVIRAEMHEVRIGARSNIQDFVMIHVGYDAPTRIGDFCSIAHHATVHGATIGDHCLVGPQASISGATIEKFLTDVYLYLDKPAVRKKIDGIVEAALTDQPTVVVGHSLGSIVAYNVLVKHAPRMKLAGFLTIGSPLGIKAITALLGLPRNPAAGRWVNAYDKRDIVALNPLNAKHFPVAPPVSNFSGVRNHTDNRHGIAGYLDDPTVARQLVAFAT